MAGRPPKPTALKLVQGSRIRKRKHEPKPRVGTTAPPWLPKDAAAEWERLSPPLLRLGLLTEVDGDAFAALCILTARLASLAQVPGSDVTDVTKELRQLWGRFGMTPADRVKVSVTPPKEEDELAAFVG
jgi:phage terminase small subunit